MELTCRYYDVPLWFCRNQANPEHASVTSTSVSLAGCQSPAGFTSSTWGFESKNIVKPRGYNCIKNSSARLSGNRTELHTDIANVCREGVQPSDNELWQRSNISSLVKMILLPSHKTDSSQRFHDSETYLYRKDDRAVSGNIQNQINTYNPRNDWNVSLMTPHPPLSITSKWRTM